jgi:hypothetical protein
LTEGASRGILTSHEKDARMLSKPSPLGINKFETKELDLGLLLLSFMNKYDAYGIVFKEKIVFFYKGHRRNFVPTLH